MKLKVFRAILTFAMVAIGLPPAVADWPQGAGPNGNFQVDGNAPVHWSVAANQNIAWKITLPETGQSTPVIHGERLFFTTMKPVESDATLGSDILAWCCHAKTGEVLWQREIAGKYPLRLSGCFSDSSSPPPLCTPDRVVFVNASGIIACFDLQGQPLWRKEILTAGRMVPVEDGGKVIVIRQNYPPEPDGVFPHKYVDSPPELWTQMEAIDLSSGESVWSTTCGVNMGCTPLLQTLADGRKVMIVGRGGGHGPPEKPEGISMIDAHDGATLWTLPLEGFMSTMTLGIRDDQVHLFHGSQHLSVAAKDGQILNQVSIIDQIPVRRYLKGQRVTRMESLADAKKGRMITQGSNLLVGPYHYFRSYTHPYLGRVNVDDGTVEYLELPLQLVRTMDRPDQFHWYVSPPPQKSGKKKSAGGPPPLNMQAIVANEVKNSRGLLVLGDKRSVGNGWGHIAAPTPSVVGEHLYVPVMNGTVYVIKWNASKLDEDAMVAINDLGPAGQSWTRASVSFAGGYLYAHTIGELICIGP